MMEWVNDVMQFLVAMVGQWGYGGIVFLMFLESSFFPVPGEVAMVPAGYLASPAYRLSESYVPGQEMNLFLAILMGIIGSILGSLVNYYVAMWLGRRLLLRFGRYILLSESRFQKIESFFLRHGEIATFTGRLIPAVRQHIAMPAGLVRMHMGRFLLFTSAGAGVWITGMSLVGYWAGQSEEMVGHYSAIASVVTLSFCLLLVTVYVLIYMMRRRQKRCSQVS